MKITLIWEVVLHFSLVDESSYVSTSSDQIFQIFLGIPEHMREHDDIFWAGQLLHFKFSLTMSKVLKTVLLILSFPALALKKAIRVFK
jgi:hypothetical protein